eukprot:112099-Hanusia_phi.AAC.2
MASRRLIVFLLPRKKSSGAWRTSVQSEYGGGRGMGGLRSMLLLSRRTRWLSLPTWSLASSR